MVHTCNVREKCELYRLRAHGVRHTYLHDSVGAMQPAANHNQLLCINKTFFDNHYHIILDRLGVVQHNSRSRSRINLYALKFSK